MEDAVADGADDRDSSKSHERVGPGREREPYGRKRQPAGQDRPGAKSIDREARGTERSGDAPEDYAADVKWMMERPEGFFMVKQGIGFHSSMKDSYEDFHYGPKGKKAGYHGAMDQGQISNYAMGQMLECVVAMKEVVGDKVGLALDCGPGWFLNDAIRFANTMAAGDLSARFKGATTGEFGELAKALNQLNVNLQAVVADVRHEVEGVQVASNQIASGNQDLSSRTEAQASSLEETAASMEQFTSTVAQSANTSREAASLSQRAATVARQGNEAMTQVVTTMDDISKSSRRIGEIIQVIDGISFQTNILALNAAVEAARAGEQGRGFAVVAGEVRNLAQRTLAAAKEIKVLIDDSASKVEQGSALVHNAGQTMGNVVGAVEQVNALIGDITSATTEQSSGIAQINQAVGQLDSVTQQNSAMVEELAAAASSLQAQAQVMNEAVRIFRLHKRGSLTT